MKQFQSTFIVAILATFLFSACSQAKYGSRTRRVKSTKIVQSKVKQEKQVAQRLVTISAIDDAVIDTVTLAQQPTKENTQALSNQEPAENTNIDNKVVQPQRQKAKPIGINRVVQGLEKRTMKNKRIKKLTNKITDARSSTSEVKDYDMDNLLRDILVIMLILILVSVILSLLPNPLSYWLSVVLTILLILYLVNILL